MDGKMKVPALRFLEFEGEWEEKKGRQLFNNKRKKGESHLPIYSVTQDKGLVPRDSLQRHMANNASDEANLQANPGDLVYNMMRMWQGAVGICHQDCMVSPAYVILEPRSVNSEFFIQLFKNTRYLYFLNVFSQGITSDRLRLYYRDFVQIKFNVPTLPEQQKIATFLSTIDTRIQQLSRKKALLEQYKKGVMQQVFAQEICFKDEDGKEFPAWEENLLGKLCVITKGEQLNKAKMSENGLYPALNGGFEPSGFTNKWNTESNTITISEGGNSCGYVNFMTQRFWCGGHCYFLENIFAGLDKAFFYQALKYSEKSLMTLRVGSGLPNIQKKDLQRFKISYPSLPEQQKIAAFLSTLDRQINLVSQQLERMQAFKKGLLQQLFV